MTVSLFSKATPTLVFLALLCLPACSPQREPPELVAHALGGIDGIKYSNSFEAYRKNLQAGYQWFEVDLTLTADGRLVCFHDRHEKHLGVEDRLATEMTAEEFLSLKYQERYSLISFRQLLEEIEDEDDVFIIVDTKGWTEEVVRAMAADVAAVGTRVRERIIPQIYSFEDWSYVEAVEAIGGKLSGVALTLYLSEESNEEVIRFVEGHRVDAVIVSKSDTDRLNPELIEGVRAAGALVFAHTVNSLSELSKLQKKKNIDGIYTDFILPTYLD